jgi:phage-related holin
MFDFLSASANKIVEEFMKMGIPLPDELTDEAVFAQYDWIINPADPATD